RPDPKTWTPAQVLEHMVITNGIYLPIMRTAVERAPTSESESQIRHSWFGNFIRKATAPDRKNTPAPRKLYPRGAAIGVEILDSWRKQQEEFLALIEQAEGIDLSRVSVRNPLLPIFRMNLADCFEIMTVHTERHVAQIEERLAAR